MDKRQGQPLPRLVIVIDEFAAMSRELPDFITGLVNIAQRGRSLGIHLILATQRPSGVVSQDIRANTNLRIALRVTDPAESADVIGVPDAASIASRPRAGLRAARACLGRAVPGRAGGRAAARCRAGGHREAVAGATGLARPRQARASPAGQRGRQDGDHRPEGPRPEIQRPRDSCASRVRTVRGWHRSRRACCCGTSCQRLRGQTRGWR